MSVTIPRKEAEYVGWLANFIAVATANQVQLGLTSSDITTLNLSESAISASVSAVLSAIAASKAAHVTKSATFHDSELLLRTYAKSIAANVNIPDALKKSLGVNVRAPKTNVPPAVPTMLVVNGNSTGVNTLQWKPNGNIRPTLYTIEALIGSATTWQIVGATISTKLDIKNVTPGVQTAYRVTATRNALTSTASNTAIIYGPQ